MGKKIFSGVQPTGNLHLGNYIGAIKNFVDLQNQEGNDCVYCVVDLHAITTKQDPKILKSSIRETTAAFLASGIDPKKSIIFNQSLVPAHSEGAWILGCIARMGWLNRMTQFKEKAGKDKEKASVGLYIYPVLMAADILLYDATHVPVGEDQKQHLELSRDIANKFNLDFNAPDFLRAPEPLIQKNFSRIMSLKDGKNKMPVMSKEDKEKLKDEIKNAVLQAAQAAGAGNVPKGVERLIKNMTEPKMDWRSLLDQHITSVVKSDYSFMRPSRKGWSVDAILPGLQPEPAVDVCVAIDTSGSISNKQLKIFLSEVKGIMDSFQDYKVHVWSFDTEVHNPEVFTPDKDITDYVPGGFGGTEFEANWTWMKENGVQPKKLIVFTDGYPWGSWGDENYCDTLWVIHSNHDKELEAPFGVTTHYENI